MEGAGLPYRPINGCGSGDGWAGWGGAAAQDLRRQPIECRGSFCTVWRRLTAAPALPRAALPRSEEFEEVRLALHATAVYLGSRDAASTLSADAFYRVPFEQVGGG